MFEAVTTQLVAHSEALHAEAMRDHDSLLAAIVRQLPDPTADTLVGLLRSRVLSLPVSIAAPSPAQLLNARYGVVPFDQGSRDVELAALRALCDDPAMGRLELRLFVGRGGAGKTRLLMHFCEELWARSNEHWHAGFLSSDLDQACVEHLARAGFPALIVIDYAESRSDLWAGLRHLLEAEIARPKLRIVLLARQAGDWWETVAMGDSALDPLLRHPVVELQDVPVAAGDRRRHYTAAFNAYLPALAMRAPTRPHELPDLTDSRFARPLYLHMAALLELLELVYALALCEAAPSGHGARARWTSRTTRIRALGGDSHASDSDPANHRIGIGAFVVAACGSVRKRRADVYSVGVFRCCAE
jgi:hypothetical protein